MSEDSVSSVRSGAPKTTWFDLPAEVRQNILSMIPDVESIVYLPTDRRRKVDARYAEAHHFHDLLLVSKTFITPDDFAFAILTSAKLTFYSYSELRRLVAEVSMSNKASIRRIHLSRTSNHHDLIHTDDNFRSFGTIEKTLSTHMPNLRQITIAWPGHCAQIARFRILHRNLLNTIDLHSPSVIECVLSDQSAEHLMDISTMHINSLSHVAASFLGDRTTCKAPFRWTRPVPWIRRLMLYAESQNIEVIIQIQVCVSFIYDSLFITHDGHHADHSAPCWSTQQTYAHDVPFRQIHIPATMSSRDYMLRFEFWGGKHARRQTLAYDLLHFPAKKSAAHWHKLVQEVMAAPYIGDGF